MKLSKRGAKEERESAPASQLIDARIRELEGWRGKTLARVRALIKEADPQIVEEWKWRVPVWSRDGIVCTGEAYKSAVKLTFPKGASLDDPAGLFNSSLDGNVRRAIDIHEGDKIDEKALKALIRAAIAANGGAAAKPAAKKATAKKATAAKKAVATKTAVKKTAAKKTGAKKAAKAPARK